MDWLGRWLGGREITEEPPRSSGGVVSYLIAAAFVILLIVTFPLYVGFSALAAVIGICVVAVTYLFRKVRGE